MMVFPNRMDWIPTFAGMTEYGNSGQILNRGVLLIRLLTYPALSRKQADT